MSQPPSQGMQQIVQDGQDIPGNSYYPPESDPTGGLPINLDSLRDGPPGSKPFYPYSTLIRYAIKGSPNQKLLLEDIYYAIESRFPYFRTAPSGWKNSVRHNLSLNPCFEKVPRPLTDRGKGSYWTVNDNVDPRTGVHRVRKKKSKNAKRSSEDVDVDFAPDASFENTPSFVQPSIHQDDGSSNRQVPYPPPYGFDPNFPLMGGMRFAAPPPMPMPLEEGLDVDEHGNINWRMAWHKELGHLHNLTAEQEKANVDPEWYRMMLFRIRSALMPPPMAAEALLHAIPPPLPPPTNPEIQQPSQPQQPTQ